MQTILAKTRINFNEEADLTASSYQKYHPKPKEYFVRDKKIKGFYIRIYPSGKKSYGVIARKGGVGGQKSKSLGDCESRDFNQVKAYARQYLFSIKEQGVSPSDLIRDKVRVDRLLSEIVKEFLELDKRLDIKTKDDYVRCIKNRMPSINRMRIQEITTSLIVDWWRASKGQRSDVKAFMYARVMMEKARAAGYVESNPFVDAKTLIGQFPSINTSTSHIPIRELGHFLTILIEVAPNLSRVARDFILFLLISGKRREEVLSLEWKDVDFERGLITFKNTKYKKLDVMPLTKLSFLLFKHRDKNKDRSNARWVFNSPSGVGHLADPFKSFKKLNDKLDLDFQVSAHVLRRTFSTATNELGLRSEDLGSLLNHKKKDVTQNYIVASQELKRKNLESIASFMNQHAQDMLNWIAVEWYGGNEDMFTPIAEEEKITKTFEDEMAYLLAENSSRFQGVGHPQFQVSN